MKPLFSNSDLKKLLIPLIIEQALSVMVGVADVIMVSQAGEAAVSGVSLVDSLNVLLMIIFNSAATGGAIVTAHYLGAKNHQKACESTEQLILATLLLSLLVAVPSLLFNHPILRFIYGGIDADVMENARIYFYLTACSYPFMAIYGACAAVCRSMGDSKSSMKVSTIMNVINVSGNALLVFFLHMGAAGVGLATLVSRIAASILMLHVVRDPNRLLHIRRGISLRLNLPMIQEIMRLGIPTGIENSTFQLGKLMVASLVASFGTVSTAANAVTGTITMFQTIPGGATSLALITVVGQCIGAQAYDQARYYEKKLMHQVIILLAILNVSFLFVMKPFIGLYSLSAEASELAFITSAMHGVLCIFIWPFSFGLPNALRAAGDVRYTMIVSTISLILCRIAGAFFLGRHLGWGLVGVWCAMFIDWTVRAIFFEARVLTGKWLAKAKSSQPK